VLDNMTPEEYVKKHLKSQKSLIYVVQLLGDAPVYELNPLLYQHPVDVIRMIDYLKLQTL